VLPLPISICSTWPRWRSNDPVERQPGFLPRGNNVQAVAGLADQLVANERDQRRGEARDTARGDHGNVIIVQPGIGLELGDMPGDQFDRIGRRTLVGAGAQGTRKDRIGFTVTLRCQSFEAGHACRTGQHLLGELIDRHGHPARRYLDHPIAFPGGGHERPRHQRRRSRQRQSAAQKAPSVDNR
jgi:hypothetical protein